MGARPRFYLVALALPSGIDRKWILKFYVGMTRLGSRFGAVLAGGDLSASISGIQITITACGDLPPGAAVLRSGGKPEDLILVTGCLGRAAAGLRLLEEGGAGRKTPAGREAIRCHLTPEPQCELGWRLAETRLARCMMDLSDGLSSDLPRLCRASGTGAEIYASRLPTFSPARRWGLDPLLLALHGGEDFELLFSIPRRRLGMFEKTCPAVFRRARIIGRLTKSGGVRWAPEPGAPLRPLAPLGWDHFRSRT
jgi:thiamine-monophosphate kinase